jgi:integrase/recombinase XerD
MTALRAKYIRDLAVRGRALRTQESYSSFVADLARYYHRSPDQLTYDQVVDWIHHLIRERRAEVYARSEIEAILTAPTQPRDRAFLMTVYAGGLRLSEATQLQTKDIDRARMQLRVRHGKGAKERVLPLSQRLLQELEDYWRAQRRGRPGHDSPWLFVGQAKDRPMSPDMGQVIYYRAVRKSGVRRKGGIHLLRHSFATGLIENGVELTLVQRLLGHASLFTTIRYLHVTTARLDAAQSPLDLIDLSRLDQPSHN